MSRLRFEPIDTWFFRESRPHATVGGNELQSLFPPPIQTLAGAVRTSIGDAMGVNWDLFKQGNAPEVQALIGQGKDLGQLAFRGPWPTLEKERLYPWPANLLQGIVEGDTKPSLGRLAIGGVVNCHLGRVRLPVLDDKSRGRTSNEKGWITPAAMAAVLKGELPRSEACRSEDELLVREPRLGIALEPGQRTTQEGNLYQTNHLRLEKGVGIEVELNGLDQHDSLQLPPVVRLGGESRLASLDVTEEESILPDLPKPNEHTRGIILYLLADARFDNNNWLPQNFTKNSEGPVHYWTGEIKGIGLKVISAVLGKSRRVGGWDLLNDQPKEVTSLIPAGSLYYCEVEGDLNRALKALHGAQIGEDNTLGRGLLAAGLWQTEESIEQGVSE
ncbi:MAG: type III-B CRISPR module-associated protein Cmr3 [gamma proteobacterium endosymbiont of Lamellibrachia anaximandri]|nr:type III-B CRISPR module-associated protein Cmr3 [gamma proteobacterium endosymbiont of Lamellibrachia anaximandri]MBL3535491.1 type III-B CRISPR module-associated protein Cmr3 [gamma proteobacterium endosymbiont of Lamellibrachia anaximandri]